MPAPKRSLASPPSSKDSEEAAPAEAAPPVRGRWVGAEACFNPQQGLIEPGDEIEVSAEQLEDPNTPVVPLDKAGTRPDPQGSDS